MRVDVKQVGRRAGVVNNGFFGMNFVAGETYKLSFYLRTEVGDRLKIRAQLESASGREVYASTTVSDAGGEWKRYECVLRPNASDANGRLTLSVDRPGTLWLDVVSLMPQATFRDRPNGLRRDLVEALAQMRPAFLRFPGGAVVGGLNLDNRFQWRNSIGDIATRKGTMNLWGYYSTFGLGFHEYLQLAEDLGADALYVCNPGFSDNYRHAEYARAEDIPVFVQEALDAIEYAIGGTSSRWGAERAKNGHPAPFRLRYVEIGNEATGKPYLDRYKLFYEAIHARYPDLVLISNLRQAEPVAPMVDDHMYGSPEKFFGEHAKYDRADRNGPKVYVGEYACNSGVGEGNLMAALSEAAYMIGLERNSDVVRMASYAPLFFNVNDIAWPVNLIGFDSSRVVKRSSYYVQKLFALNRPDEMLRTTMNPAPQGDAGSVYALAGFHRASGEVVLKAVNPSGVTRKIQLEVAGLRIPAQRARVTTLAYPDATTENTIDEPDLIVPIESGAEASGQGWNIRFRLTPSRFYGWFREVVSREQVTGFPPRVFSRLPSPWDSSPHNGAYATARMTGNAPLDTVEGPGRNNIDMTFTKTFPIREKKQLTFRWEIYTIFNHPSFYQMNVAARFDPTTGQQVNAGFGQLTNTLTPRQMQLSLRFAF